MQYPKCFGNDSASAQTDGCIIAQKEGNRPVFWVPMCIYIYFIHVFIVFETVCCKL